MVFHMWFSSISVVVVSASVVVVAVVDVCSAVVVDVGDVVVEGSYFTTFVEEGDPVSITSQHLEITDIDSGFNNLSYAIVCIKDSMDNEVLNVTLTDNIRLSANSNNTWLNLTGPAPIEEYEDALRSIR